MLTIKDLHVKLEEEDKQILKGVDLTVEAGTVHAIICLLYTSPSPRDRTRSRMPSSA